MIQHSLMMVVAEVAGTHCLAMAVEEAALVASVARSCQQEGSGSQAVLASGHKEKDLDRWS